MTKAATILTALLMLTLMLLVPEVWAVEKIRSLCEIGYPSDSRIPWSCLKVKVSDTPEKLFGAHWQGVLRFNRLDRRHFLGGVSVKVPRRLEQAKNFNPLPATYPQAAREPKFILVDQTEMFLGAYQYGRLVYSFPIALGLEGKMVPNGSFRIDAADLRHKSNLYEVEDIGRPYPMHYGLRFWVDKSRKDWPSYWIHGRDLPGYPVSHGCIGLYDEEMQKDYYAKHDKKVYGNNYHPLTRPFLEDAKTLYRWVVNPKSDPGEFHEIKNGPLVVITGRPPQ